VIKFKKSVKFFEPEVTDQRYDRVPDVAVDCEALRNRYVSQMSIVDFPVNTAVTSGAVGTGVVVGILVVVGAAVVGVAVVFCVDVGELVAVGLLVSVGVGVAVVIRVAVVVGEAVVVGLDVVGTGAGCIVTGYALAFVRPIIMCLDIEPLEIIEMFDVIT
jgi:hypothetical protein